MIRKTLIYITFIIACFTTTYTFMNADTYVQLVAATISYPLLAFAALKLFPRKQKSAAFIQPEKETINQLADGGEHTSVSSLGAHSITEAFDSIENEDKREFFRLIGIAGISFFVYSLLNKRAEASFLGKAISPSSIKLEDTSGNIISPSQEHPTDGYQISDLDEYNPEYIYYGCTKADGSWYIMQQDPYSGSFRYVKGNQQYAKSWSNRERLSYGYYHDVFGK